MHYFFYYSRGSISTWQLTMIIISSIITIILLPTNEVQLKTMHIDGSNLSYQHQKSQPYGLYNLIINSASRLHTCPFIKTFFFFSFMLRGEGSNRFMCPPSTGVRSRGLYPRPNWSCFGLGRYSVSTSSGAYVTSELQSTSSSPSSSLSPPPTPVKQKVFFQK